MRRNGRKVLQAIGVVLIVGGVLLTSGFLDRSDRQGGTVGGAPSGAIVRAKWAPGWGLLSLVAGGALVVAGRRRPEPPTP